MASKGTWSVVFDDKTVRRLIGFTKKFSFGGFYLGNLHSTITPYPDPDKFVADDLTNINHIRMMHQKCDQVIFGWGNLGKCPLWLEKMIKKPLCFGINKNGTPSNDNHKRSHSNARWRFNL